MRISKVPYKVDQFLEKKWNLFAEKEKNEISKQIIQMSHHYQNPEGLETPWQDFSRAYLFYFFPLNLARGSALFQSFEKHFSWTHDHLFDVGAGIGNLNIYQKVFPNLLSGDLTFIEHSSVPTDLFPTEGKWLKKWPSSIPPKSLGFFSFSWVEMKTSAKELASFESLVLMEPSTSNSARKLMALRSELIEEGFQILAPCTHQKSCPLLIHSQKDWCHDRIHFEPSPWFLDLEDRLPMKNRTLTFSYLVATKGNLKSNFTGEARVIGDTLKEKGKTRQAGCLDDERRFLSWLKKDFKNPETLDHGILIQIDGEQEKGNELRVTPTTRIEELGPDRKIEIL